MKTAIIGGGAAGFFLAINLKKMVPNMEVTIFERSKQVLKKVEISGGGRCNCTNSFEGVVNFKQVYPRGHRLMKRLIKNFSHEDAYRWFEKQGVPLVTQDDHCVFPAAQDSHAIINCFLKRAEKLNIGIELSHKINSLKALADFDFIAVTTGGSPQADGLQWLLPAGIEIVEPVPSLFSFTIVDSELRKLKGIVASDAIAMIPGSKMKADGPLLVTPWGLSGPAILKLSSYAARLLHEHNFRMPLIINWMGRNEVETGAMLLKISNEHKQKQVASFHPQDISARLWEYLTVKAIGEKAFSRWSQLSKKDFNKIHNAITNDHYTIAGRTPFREEFVTCGGVSLDSIDYSTLECKTHPNLYFAGEVLNIDGITGGFNFQAAWSTAFTVAASIAKKAKGKNGVK